MKIAVTYDNGQIFQHFGHTETFKVYEVEGKEIRSSQIIGTNGTGHGALATLLRDLGARVLICGGIGAGAQNALAEAGVQLFGGVTGDADAAVPGLSGRDAGLQSQRPVQPPRRAWPRRGPQLRPS